MPTDATTPRSHRLRSHRRPIRNTVRRVVGSAAAITLTLSLGLVTRGGEAAVVPASPGRFDGYAFDACTAPSNAAMDAWLQSHYRGVGIYFGGVNRGCAQPNLTAAWVARQQSKGWKMIPLYVGLQAPCRNTTKPRIVAAQAAAQGLAEANDAAAKATALGLGRGSVLVFDMEAYAIGDAGCTAAVQTFMSAWTKRLHQLGFFSGFYSSMSSGVADMVAAYHRPDFVRPDFIDFARWDGVDTLTDAGIPAGYWANQRRMKQYRGGHTETHGGVTLNVDSNRIDWAPVPATPNADSTGDGWSDLVARDSTGGLWLFPGLADGAGLSARRSIGTKWTAMNAIVRAGDFDRRGYEDLLARNRSSGKLYLYTGRSGGALNPAKEVGSGFNAVRDLTPIGDLNRDSNRDLVAVRSATGELLLYPGRGTGAGLLAPVVVGTGWEGYSELAGGGDHNRDGRPDLVARETATGNLYVHLGGDGAFGERVLIASGAGTLREITPIGDFDRDGYPDLVAIDTGSQRMYLYRGTAELTLAPRVLLGRGWTTYGPIA